MNTELYITDTGAIRRAQDYIRENFNRDLPLSEVAEYVHLSPTYFSTLFTRVCGKNFSDYLRTCRLEAAKFLLSRGDTSVRHTAERVGYRSTAYFIKNFADAFGITPGEFKKQHLPKS